MSRLRDDLFTAKIENATLKLEVKAAEREVDRLTAALNQAVSDAAKAQMETSEYKVNNAVLLERLDLLAINLPPAPTEAFNHISEEREDADYQLHAGLIDRDEYEAILASAGALNTEISFDSDLTRL